MDNVNRCLISIDKVIHDIEIFFVFQNFLQHPSYLSDHNNGTIAMEYRMGNVKLTPLTIKLEVYEI